MPGLYSPIAIIDPAVDGWGSITQPGPGGAGGALATAFGDGQASAIGAWRAITLAQLAGAGLDQFGGDFYGRIHISQSLLQLGNLIGRQVREVRVWNAFLVAQQLAAIGESGTDGITITGDPAPVVFTPLQERLYTIEIDTEGPPTIDASFVWDFAPHDVSIRILGSRVTAWTFAPDWSAAILERMEWKTDVLTAFDGSEQRRALRLAPRKAYEFDAFFLGRARRYAEAAAWGWGARVWALPVWPDGVDTKADTAAGALFVSCDTEALDFEAGSFAIFLADVFTFEVIEVEDVAPGGLTLKRPTRLAWPAPARLYPARTARLRDSVRFSRWDFDASAARVAFELAEPVDNVAALPTTTHRGLPVLERRPDWQGGFDLELRRKLAEIDNEIGISAVDDEGEIAIPLQRMGWTLTSRDDRATFRAMLYALKGRRGSLWVPTWENDLEVVETIVSSAPSIDVAFMAYATQLAQQPGRRDVRIELVDGSVFYRRITGSLQLTDAVERLQLDAALGVTVTPDQVRAVSFMALCRLESDAVELAHWTGDVCESATTFRGFRNDL